MLLQLKGTGRPCPALAFCVCGLEPTPCLLSAERAFGGGNLVKQCEDTPSGMSPLQSANSSAGNRKDYQMFSSLYSIVTPKLKTKFAQDDVHCGQSYLCFCGFLLSRALNVS